MKSRYPFILVHGVMLKDFKFLRAFGRIEKNLNEAGFKVYTAQTDGFGTIENNAEQLKKEILEILDEENAEKINIIAHSKGGLDGKYMIENLNMREKTASLTTLCTPHKGSQIATMLLRLPDFLKRFIALWINLVYRIFGDEKPDALKVCKQLERVNGEKPQDFDGIEGVYCQSYSSTLKKSRDDFIMGIPLTFSKRLEKDFSDGLVSVDSSKFGNYRGDCIDESVSHLQILGYAAGKKKKEKIYSFYLQVLNELADFGF